MKSLNRECPLQLFNFATSGPRTGAFLLPRVLWVENVPLPRKAPLHRLLMSRLVQSHYACRTRETAGLPEPEQFLKPLLQRRVRDSLPRMKSSSATRPRLAAAQTAAALCLDLKANDVVILDLEGVSDMTDCFVIASGSSDTHVRAIAEHVAEEMKKRGIAPHHLEGLNQGRWALVDFVDFVVHVFHPTLRSFYQLERLWGDAAVVAVVPQGAGT